MLATAPTPNLDGPGPLVAAGHRMIPLPPATRSPSAAIPRGRRRPRPRGRRSRTVVGGTRAGHRRSEAWNQAPRVLGAPAQPTSFIVFPTHRVTRMQIDIVVETRARTARTVRERRQSTDDPVRESCRPRSPPCGLRGPGNVAPLPPGAHQRGGSERSEPPRDSSGDEPDAFSSAGRYRPEAIHPRSPGGLGEDCA